MPRRLRIIAAQAAPFAIGAPFEQFAAQARQWCQQTGGADLLVCPELHLQHPAGLDLEDGNRALRQGAQPLDGRLDAELRQLARELSLWLVPGSVCEQGADGELFNTAVVYSPAGERVASYRKVFPWRPSEPYDPGAEFVVFEIPGLARIGLSICYDAWFPECARQLAWSGADLILNLVKTTTPDREQEVILARAAAIVNQVFVVSVNCAAPVGMGRSVIVGPQGDIRHECQDAEPGLLVDEMDLSEVDAVRANGTCGSNRMWSQFRDGEKPIGLACYSGRIDTQSWTPPAFPQRR